MFDRKIERFYDAGYAVMVYDPDSTKRVWRFRDEAIELPANAVKEINHLGLRGRIASIDEVRKAANA